MLFADAIESFIEHCAAVMNLSEHTLRAYRGDLKTAQSLWKAEHTICRLDKESLRSYIRHQREVCKSKESTIKRRVASLKLFFKWAHRESLIESNPFDGLYERIRLPGRLPRALDGNDAKRLKSAVGTMRVSDDINAACERLSILLLLETGIRVSELTSIRMEDVSISDKSIKIMGKGNRQRLVYFLSNGLGQSMNSYLQKRGNGTVAHNSLLALKCGNRVKPPRIRAWLRKTASDAGINRTVTPHMLRHTCATHWLESGLDIRFVQKLLGHHSISTTEIYTHVSDQGLRNALAKTSGGG